MKKRNLFSVMLTLVLPMFLYGQNITGVVTSETGEPLVGANVVVNGTDVGAATGEDGTYAITIGPGSYTVTASNIGFKSLSTEVEVGSKVQPINFVLELNVIELTDIEVLASRAGEKTPVAYTTVAKEELELDQVASQRLEMS